METRTLFVSVGKNGAGHYFINDRTQTTVFEEHKPDYRKMKKEELVDILENMTKDNVNY